MSFFLDSFKDSYVGWWPEVKRVLRPGGCSSRQPPSPMRGNGRIHDACGEEREVRLQDVPVGTAELVAVKGRGRRRGKNAVCRLNSRASADSPFRKGERDDPPLKFIVAIISP